MTLKTQGFVLIDVDVAALNNAGKNTDSNYENAVATKKIIKNRRAYTYVSGQAWRYWWRDTLQRQHGWKLSPILKDGKIAFTEANPVMYADDDVFGYMRAASEKIIDEQTGKTKKGADITVTRTSPLKNSVIISVASVRAESHWSTSSRHEGDPVPYAKEEYSAVMKGMFSLDLAQVGTFSSYNRTGFKNLNEAMAKAAREAGAVEIADPYYKGDAGDKARLLRLPLDVRKQRIIDTIQALKSISGGAMQTNNMVDVTPKFIILATTNSGNHPFSHIAGSESNKAEDKAVLNMEALQEVLHEYKDQFQGKVFIGKRTGFWDEYNEALQALESLGVDYAQVQFGAVNEIIDRYCDQLDSQLD